MAINKYEAPDGGWGWFIVLAFALNNFITIPIMQGFGLIYKEEFCALGISVTDAMVLTNINSAFGMILGLMNGPLIRTYGFRRTAIAGALMYSGGVIATSFSKTFTQFIIFYGLITSYGMGLSMSSYAIALNTYFLKKRRQAVSTYVTITALGPIMMPPVQSLLISNYGPQGTMFILGALSLNSLVSALLLHPIEWHAKKVDLELKEVISLKNEETVPLKVTEYDTEKNNAEHHENNNLHHRKKTITASSMELDAETASIYGYETPMSQHRRFSSYSKNSDMIDLGSFEDDLSLNDEGSKCNNADTYSTQKQNDAITDKKRGNNTDQLNMSKSRNCLLWMVHFFDLDLLKDPIYMNLMFGMSIALLAELNFSLLTPFILSDMSLLTNEIASVMSVIGIGDLIFRAITPIIGKFIKQSFRMMYLYSLVLLIISRSALIFARSYHSILGIAVCLGIAKGLRSVYMPLIIPDYIKSLERLSSASSIQLLVNGCFLLLAGPLMGIIRDLSSSYIPCIGFINSLTALTIIMWMTEIAIRRIRQKSIPNVT